MSTPSLGLKNKASSVMPVLCWYLSWLVLESCEDGGDMFLQDAS
jgi:hypothetical protein